MNPQIPRADDLPIPGPPWLFQVLLLVTLLLHFLAMNSLVGGTFVAALSLSRRADGDDWLARRVVKALPVAFAATVTLGVAPLLFAQVLYGRLLYTSSVLLAWPWLALPVTALVAYALTYRLSSQAGTERGPRPALAWVVFGLLVAVATVFVQNMTLMLDPDRWKALYLARPDGLNSNFADPQVVPRLVFVLSGAIAVGSLFVALLARSGARGFPDLAARGCRTALRTVLGAGAVMVPAGVAVVLAQPVRVREALVGGSLQGTAALAVGVLLGAYVAVGAWRALRAETFTAPVPRLAVCAAGVVASMVLVRDSVRRAWLAEYFRVEEQASAPQWGVFLLFLVLFAAGIAVLVWMVHAWRDAAGRDPTAIHPAAVIAPNAQPASVE